ncbi:MAG: DnaJ domain-containing protein [Chloroflexi bacterium]|nr:DnaJ domain-containing protein [Chloroflexota bacterium]
MNAVSRLPPGDSGAEPVPNGSLAAEADTTALATPDDEATRALELAPGPRLPADPGLYAVLGLDPSVSDGEIQTTYRRRAARLSRNGGDPSLLRQLNVAYEVLGNPYRRAEYDRLRTSQVFSPGPPTPVRTGAKATTRVTRRRRPRHVVQPRYAGLGDVLVVLTVVGLAVVVGALLIPRISINLSMLNVLSNVVPVNATRPIVAPAATAVPTAAPTPTLRPGVADRFAGSSINVSNPTPGLNTVENVVVKLRQDGHPAANMPVYSLVHYRTTDERWPATGTVSTDGNGAATISFNIGGATPNYPVQVQVFAQADDQQMSWSTSFTPH